MNAIGKRIRRFMRSWQREFAGSRAGEFAGSSSRGTCDPEYSRVRRTRRARPSRLRAPSQACEPFHPFRPVPPSPPPGTLRWSAPLPYFPIKKCARSPSRIT
jgi:hypothetical protein